MSYQVNFRLFIPDCEYWETEALQMLRGELIDALKDAAEKAGVHGKTIGICPVEVAYLAK